MKIKNILCPVDFSTPSDISVQHAESLASLFGARLYLLHVIEHLHGDEHYMILMLTPQEIAEKMKKEAEKQLNNLAKKIKKELKVMIEVREGKAFVEIVKAAGEKNIDLIVMGSHGRTGLSHVLIGSVAERVVRKAQCPVLIVKNKDRKFKMP